MSAGCVASQSSAVLVVTSRAPGLTSATCECVSSEMTSRVLCARWPRFRGPIPPPPTPLQLSLGTGQGMYPPGYLPPFSTPPALSPPCLTPPPPGGTPPMPQVHLCIDCARTVDHIVRGRCSACSPAANKERRKKHGHMTGKMTPARKAHTDFVSSPAWRRVSKLVRERDGSCVRCGSTRQLTAHHIIPVRVDPSVALDVDNCVTLCRSCHGKVEGGRGQ
jgi:5-methylcytosine-specific restriction protein A